MSEKKSLFDGIPSVEEIKLRMNENRAERIALRSLLRMAKEIEAIEKARKTSEDKK
tara:strand:- start:2703 stop:2870 length:168 start_codon:yes stop_codon:yes gene_type:complete